MDPLIEETLKVRLTLVHGDYSPKNILVFDDRLVLLDHEVAHYGDPAFDVGFSLTHLLSKALHVAFRRREFLDAAQVYVRTYLESLRGIEGLGALEARAVRHTLACLLARVAGRSPLEYLTPTERQEQLRISLQWMPRPPHYLSDLIHAFSEELDAACSPANR
jgi:Ser/Thr protein kinase RdoA (MazF antagonist)